MTKFVGRRGEIAIAKETSRGVAGSTLFWVPFGKLSFDDKAVIVRETQGLGKIADGDSAYVTNKNATGDIDNETYDKALGLFLSSLIGATPSSSAGPPYTHTFTLNNTNQHQSLTIYYQDPDYTKVFTNAVVDKWKMKIAENAIVEHTWSFASRASDDWSTLTPNYTSLGSKFLHQHLNFKLAATIAGLAGATKISLKNLELNVDANAMFDNALGTVEPQDVLNQQFSVSGKLTLNKNDDTYRQLMLGGTYQSLQIVLTNTANSILTIQLPRVHFPNWQQDRSLDKITSQTIDFVANYDAANALDIISTLTLVNTQASY